MTKLLQEIIKTKRLSKIVLSYNLKTLYVKGIDNFTSIPKRGKKQLYYLK